MTFEKDLDHMHRCWFLDFLEKLRIESARPKDLMDEFDRAYQRGAIFEEIK